MTAREATARIAGELAAWAGARGGHSILSRYSPSLAHTGWGFALRVSQDHGTSARRPEPPGSGVTLRQTERRRRQPALNCPYCPDHRKSGNLPRLHCHRQPDPRYYTRRFQFQSSVCRPGPNGSIR
jgi:hypothetical protein